MSGIFGADAIRSALSWLHSSGAKTIAFERFAMSSATFRRPGLKCQKCGLPFALSLTGTVSASDIEKLPDPFDATCSICGHVDSYPKADIQPLVSTGHG